MAEFNQLYAVEEGISIDDATGIISGDPDPSLTSPGTNIPESTLYIRISTNQLYQKTGPAVTDWSLVPVFGSEYLYIEDETVSITTSTTFQEKLSLSTPATLPAGTYRIGWSYRFNHNNNGNDFEGRVQLDNTTDIDFVKVEPKDSAGNFGGSGSSQRYVVSGFKNVVLTAGVHTIDIDYRTDSGGINSAIWEARIEFWRVG